jgi:uncharacterized damage-inducible protein DinB
MSNNRKALVEMVSRALSGKGAHAQTKTVFAGLDWKVAGIRPKGVPHSLFQLLNHMVYWQEWVVRWLKGEKPPIPKHASAGWPGSPAPASAREWQRALGAFRSGLDTLARQSRQADLFARRGKLSGLEMLQAIFSHNSYHAGQVVLLRQTLGAWPASSRGLTW